MALPGKQDDTTFQTDTNFFHRVVEKSCFSKLLHENLERMLFLVLPHPTQIQSSRETKDAATAKRKKTKHLPARAHTEKGGNKIKSEMHERRATHLRTLRGDFTLPSPVSFLHSSMCFSL